MHTDNQEIIEILNRSHNVVRHEAPFIDVLSDYFQKKVDEDKTKRDTKVCLSSRDNVSCTLCVRANMVLCSPGDCLVTPISSSLLALCIASFIHSEFNYYRNIEKRLRKRS